MKHKQPLPPREELLRLFSYDPITGELRWRVDRSPFTRRYRAGSLIDYRTPPRDGYIRASWGSSGYYAHCIIWKMLYGTEPEEIDHINRIKYDNRLENLRPSDRYGNNWNSSMRRDNTSGHRGITRNGRGWRAGVGGFYLGTFRMIEAAVAAREQYIRENINT